MTEPILYQLEKVLEELELLRAQILLARLLNTFDLFLSDLDNRVARIIGPDSVTHSYIKQIRELLADQDLLDLNLDTSIELDLALKSSYRFMREEIEVAFCGNQLEQFALQSLSDLNTKLTMFWKQG